jgi:hypothetical protein
LDWSEAVCAQLGSFFCAGGDGRNHDPEVLFVTLCDDKCVRSSNDRLSEETLQWIKNRLRYGLRGLSYFAIIEPAYYVNFQSGFHYGRSKRCMSWHLHALVWGISKEDMCKRLTSCRRKGWYIALGKGLKPTHVKPVEQGRLARAVGYLLKSPVSAYRVSMVDCVDRQRRVRVDKNGVVLRKFKQGRSPLRHGERLILYRTMRHLYLDDLTLAGGEGVALFRKIKYSFLKARDSASHCRGLKIGPGRIKNPG